MTATRPAPGTWNGKGVRRPAVAGTFYPSDGVQLRTMVDDLLDAAHRRTPPEVAPAPLAAVIAPHAGFIYSGPIAASAYVLVRPHRAMIRRVALLGPSHRVPVRGGGIALSSAAEWSTPLGRVPLDAAGCRAVAALDAVEVDDRPHANEHSLEVHLPFLQRVLDPGWSLVPLVVGRAATPAIADAIEVLWTDPDTLVVVSTDLSHHHPAPQAEVLDAETVGAIVRLAPLVPPERACGAYPVSGLCEAVRRHDPPLEVTLVDRRHSGNTAGSNDAVVGYAAFVVRRPPAATDDEARRRAEADALLDMAEGAIRERLAGRAPPARPDPLPEALRAPGASFVTLLDGDRLLGCVGTLDPRRPLIDDVASNALAAAFADPRLPAVTADDADRMTVKVSVLSARVPLDVHSIQELLAVVRPGVDGLSLQTGRHRGTFLPSVWAQLPDPADFVEHLWRKAGLRPGTWPADLEVTRYTTVEHSR